MQVFNLFSAHFFGQAQNFYFYDYPSAASS